MKRNIITLSLFAACMSVGSCLYGSEGKGQESQCLPIAEEFFDILRKKTQVEEAIAEKVDELGEEEFGKKSKDWKSREGSLRTAYFIWHDKYGEAAEKVFDQQPYCQKEWNDRYGDREHLVGLLNKPLKELKDFRISILFPLDSDPSDSFIDRFFE